VYNEVKRGFGISRQRRSLHMMNAPEDFGEKSSAAEAGTDIGREQPAGLPELGSAPELRPEIRIGTTVMPRQWDAQGGVAAVFTMTLGTETIPLVPLKNWRQLDVFKWKARGLLPRTPAGLEIAPEHLKVAGETVSTLDPEGCAKLEKAFNDWLASENEALEAAKAKAQTPKAPTPHSLPEEHTLHFQVEMNDAGQARIKCLEGNETVKVVALNAQGFNALIEQRLMRKPGSMKVGALHDWVELDGELIRFQEGMNGAHALELALNERYAPGAE